MEYLFYALLAVASFFASFIAWFVWNGGLEPGPLATWISGFASTSAVAVALWGQWRVQQQRLEDKQEKLEATAYQILIKATTLLQFATAFRRGIRDSSRINDYHSSGKTVQLLDMTTQASLITHDRVRLTDADENLFARAGAFAALQKLHAATDAMRILSLAAADQSKQQTALYDLSRDNQPVTIDTMSVEWDYDDNKTRQALILNSHLTLLAQALATDALNLALAALPGVRKLSAQYTTNDNYDERYLLAAQKELALPFAVIESDAEKPSN